MDAEDEWKKQIMKEVKYMIGTYPEMLFWGETKKRLQNTEGPQAIHIKGKRSRGKKSIITFKGYLVLPSL